MEEPKPEAESEAGAEAEAEAEAGAEAEAESGEQAAESGEQAAESREQPAESGEQGAEKEPESPAPSGEWTKFTRNVAHDVTKHESEPSALAVQLGALNARCSPAVNTLSRAALVVACYVFAIVVFQIRFLPALGTDTLIYHLATPATWLHEGYLAPLDFPFHDNGVEQSPMLSQTLFYLLMKLSGDTGLVWLVQPAFFVGLIWLYFRSARLLGASQSLALVLTAAVVLFPPFMQNAGLANNDLILTTGCALTLYGLLVTRCRRSRGLILGALGVALMLLTKANGLIVTAVALPAFGPALWQELRGPEGTWRWKTPALVLGIGVFGAAFFWRNLFTYGNPVWPGTFKLAGITLFDGLFDYGLLVNHGWAWAKIGPLVWDGKGDDVHFVSLPLSAVLWAGWLGSAVLCFLRPGVRRRAWTRAACCVWFPLGVVLLVLSSVPFYDEPRYMFPAFYALWLAVANALALSTRLMRRELTAFVPALCLVLFLGVHPTASSAALTLEFWAVAVLAGAALWFVTPQLRQRYGRLALLGALALAGILTLLGPTWYPTFRKQRLELRPQLYVNYYPDHGWAWAGLDELSAEQPLTVAYAGTPMILPLFGARLQNHVVYVPVSPADEPQPVDLSGKPADVPPGLWSHQSVAVVRRREVDDAFWLGKLSELEVDVLFLADDPFRGGVQQELGMIGRHPERFALLKAEGGTAVYRVLPAR